MARFASGPRLKRTRYRQFCNILGYCVVSNQPSIRALQGIYRERFRGIAL